MNSPQDPYGIIGPKKLNPPQTSTPSLGSMPYIPSNAKVNYADKKEYREKRVIFIIKNQC